MDTEIYQVIGVMSGTSLDGLDMAYCSFWKKNNKWCFRLEKAKSVSYKKDFVQQLKESVNLSAVELLKLNNDFGTWCGEQVRSFVQENKLKVDFVASHGHTVFHQTDKSLTYQIGAGHHIAIASGLKTICDFRSLDVALGGQGAPLVPIGDQLIFSEYDFCLNLGGISNISFIHKGKRVAYDIAPANMLLGHILIPTGKPYDDRGFMARSGNLQVPLLEALNSLAFYKSNFPKSLGYEWFCSEMAPLVSASEGTVQDKLHTAIHHIAQQISKAISPFASEGNKLLVTGGGAKNLFLVEIIKKKLEDKVSIEIPSETIVDFKEAIVFGLMGVLRERNEINCLSSVTGASHDSCGGVIFPPS